MLREVKEEETKMVNYSTKSNWMITLFMGTLD